MGFCPIVRHGEHFQPENGYLVVFPGMRKHRMHTIRKRLPFSIQNPVKGCIHLKSNTNRN